MKVLINALQAGNRSGTGRYVTELLRALPRADSAVRVTALWPAGAAAELPDSIELIRQGGGLLGHHVAGAWRLAAAARERGVELVHHPASFGPGAGRIPIVLTAHDMAVFRHPEWFRADRAWYYRHAFRWSLRRAVRVIVDSHAAAEDVAVRGAYPAERIDVVPLGVDEAFRPMPAAACAEVRARYGLPERFFLYVGTWEPRKNLARLVDAWSSLGGKELPALVLGGRRGWKTQGIEKAIARSGRRAHIYTPGFIAEEDLPALLSAAVAFVWPSLFEGFGLPPLEAMACGCPVLTSNSSSLPETVGDAALTVAPEDTGGIAEGLRTLAEEAGLREKLQVKGRTRAAAFTWGRTAALTLESYRKAAS